MHDTQLLQMKEALTFVSRLDSEGDSSNRPFSMIKDCCRARPAQGSPSSMMWLCTTKVDVTRPTASEAAQGDREPSSHRFANAGIAFVQRIPRHRFLNEDSHTGT